MTYEIYRYIFMGGAVLAGIMLIVSIVLFFYLKIPNVIGDLTGINAKRAIEEIRLQNENTGHKTYKSSVVNQNRGKLTEKISPSGNLLRYENSVGAMATEKISTQQLAPNETTVLNISNEGLEDTTVLNTYTSIGNETTLLTEFVSEQSSIFEIEFEITYIHTNEIISV